MRYAILNILFALSLSACAERMVEGSGTRSNQTRSPQTLFTRIECDAPVDITIEPGTAQQNIEISGYSNLLEHVKTEVKDNTLKIYIQEGISLRSSKGDLHITVQLPVLDGIEVSGSGVVNIIRPVNINRFEADLSGAGELHIAAINATEFEAEISGSAQVDIAGGNVQKASYDISGSGDIDAGKMQCAIAAADISGSGNITLMATQELDASVSGSGAVQYAGNPQKVNKQVSGSGSVTAL